MRLTYEELAQTIIDASTQRFDRTPAQLVGDLIGLVRREEREACSKLVCSRCRTSDPMYVLAGYYGRWHKGQCGAEHEQCPASALYVSEETISTPKEAE